MCSFLREQFQRTLLVSFPCHWYKIPNTYNNLFWITVLKGFNLWWLAAKQKEHSKRVQQREVAQSMVARQEREKNRERNREKCWGKEFTLPGHTPKDRPSTQPHLQKFSNQSKCLSADEYNTIMIQSPSSEPMRLWRTVLDPKDDTIHK